jgi:hypothetical protein
MVKVSKSSLLRTNESDDILTYPPLGPKVAKGQQRLVDPLEDDDFSILFMKHHF